MEVMEEIQPPPQQEPQLQQDAIHYGFLMGIVMTSITRWNVAMMEGIAVGQMQTLNIVLSVHA